MQNLTVLGTGVLGSQIIFQAAFKGKNVVGYDITDGILAKLPERWEQIKQQFKADLPDTPQDKLDDAVSRIRVTADLADAVKDADIVIEAIPERLDIKQETWEKVGKLAPAKTIFCTNSSTLMPSKIAPFTGRPDKFLALHFANHIWKSNTGEVMMQPKTDPAVFEEVAQFAKEIGMVPIRIKKEHPRYVLNSLLVPLFDAAADLWVEGIASIEDIDTTWRIATGAPLGPFQIFDEVGMVTAYNISHGSTPEIKKEFQRRVKEEYVDKGYLGQNSGRGFYNYQN